MNKSILALVIATLTFPSPAQTPAPAVPVTAPVVAPAPRLTPIGAADRPAPLLLTDDERVYYENEARLVRQLRLLELQAKIAEQQRKAGAAAVTVPSPPIPLPTNEVAHVSAPADYHAAPPRLDSKLLPSPLADSIGFNLVSIWGVEDDLRAQIVSNGMQVAVKKGDTLPGGWVLENVARTGIVVTKGKTRRALMLGG